MDYKIFIGQNKYFARARAHAYESIKKLMLFSIILILPSVAGFSDANPDRQKKIDANANLFLHKGAAAKNQFIQQLAQETDPQIRVNILGILAACNLKSDSITAIEPSLSDTDPFVRSQALITLARIGGPAAVADLINTLTNDSNVGVRGTAVFWLGSLKDPSAMTAIGNAVEHDADANVRIEAAQALKTIGTSAARSQRRRGKNDPDERVRKLANE